MELKLFKVEQDPRSESLPDIITETPVWLSGDQSQLPQAPVGYMWGTSVEDVEETIATKNRDEFNARNHVRLYQQ